MAAVNPNFKEHFQKMLIDKKKRIKLSDFSCEYDEKLIKKVGLKKIDKKAKDFLQKSKEDLIDAHEKLWACKKYGLLIVLQGMDTAGKDGTIRHILSGVNPQGCRIQGFKVPTAEEHLHSFLWRYQKVAPARGEIVVFNRSHYEDVLVVKVHPEFMETLPESLNLQNNKEFWNERYEDINAYEKHLANNGFIVLKFFLHISKDEQKKRLLERLTIEDKYWKISPADLKERKYWDNYIEAYEDMLSNTGHKHAPWIIVPSNDKKVARAIVAQVIADTIDGLDIAFPTLTKEEIAELKEHKKALESE